MSLNSRSRNLELESNWQAADSQAAGPMASELILNKFINKIVLGFLQYHEMMTTPSLMCIVWIIDKLSSPTSEAPDDASKAGAAVTGDITLHWLSVVSPQIEEIPTSCNNPTLISLTEETFEF